MLEVIKGILKKVAGMVVEAKGPYRTYNADGRPNETLRGKFIQHYGFASSPTEGTENVVLEYGNNSISVAENPGKIKEGGIVSVLEPGEVLLYNPDNSQGSIVYLVNPSKGSPDNQSQIIIGSGDVQIISGDTDGGGVNLTAVYGNVNVEAGAGSHIQLGSTEVALLKKLVNDTFMTLYNAHTHTAPGGTTGAPVVAMTSANLTSTTQAI